MHWLQRMNMSCSFWHTEIRCLITENLSFQFIIAKFLNNCLTWVFQWQSKDDKLAGNIFFYYILVYYIHGPVIGIYIFCDIIPLFLGLLFSIIHLLMTEFLSLFTIAIFAKNNFEKLHLNFFKFCLKLAHTCMHRSWHYPLT